MAATLVTPRCSPLPAGGGCGSANRISNPSRKSPCPPAEGAARDKRNREKMTRKSPRRRADHRN